MSKIQALKSEVARLNHQYRVAVQAERNAEIEADAMFRSGKSEAECEKFHDFYVDATAYRRAALVDAEIQLEFAINGWDRSEIR